MISRQLYLVFKEWWKETYQPHGLCFYVIDTNILVKEEFYMLLTKEFKHDAYYPFNRGAKEYTHEDNKRNNRRREEWVRSKMNEYERERGWRLT